MSNFDDDFAFTSRHIDSIVKILAPLVIKPADFKTDTEQATDFVTLCAKDVYVAARIRRWQNHYPPEYGREFTVRSKRDTGAKTELKKIQEGFGQFMIYGWARETATSVERWSILSLDGFRENQINNGPITAPKEKSNGDGTHFIAYKIGSFKNPPILVASNFLRMGPNGKIVSGKFDEGHYDLMKP